MDILIGNNAYIEFLLDMESCLLVLKYNLSIL